MGRVLFSERIAAKGCLVSSYDRGDGCLRGGDFILLPQRRGLVRLAINTARLGRILQLVPRFFDRRGAPVRQAASGYPKTRLAGDTFTADWLTWRTCARFPSTHGRDGTGGDDLIPCDSGASRPHRLRNL